MRPEVFLQICLEKNTNPWSAPQSIITHADESEANPICLCSDDAWQKRLTAEPLFPLLEGL